MMPGTHEDQSINDHKSDSETIDLLQKAVSMELGRLDQVEEQENSTKNRDENQQDQNNNAASLVSNNGIHGKSPVNTGIIHKTAIYHTMPVNINPPDRLSIMKEISGGIQLTELLNNHQMRENDQIGFGYPSISSLPCTITTTTASYSQSMSGFQSQSHNTQPIMTTRYSSEPYQGLLQFQQHIGSMDNSNRERHFTGQMESIQRLPPFQVPYATSMLNGTTTTNTHNPQRCFNGSIESKQGLQPSAPTIEQYQLPPPITESYPPLPIRNTANLPSHHQPSFSSALRHSGEQRTPGSGGRPSIRRQRDEEHTENLENTKKPKTSQTEDEQPPLMIEGNLTGFENIEAINAEVEKYMNTDKIERIKFTWRGKIVVIPKTEDDGPYLLTHYPIKDIFNGQTTIRKAKERVDFTNSLVIQDIPLGSSNEEIIRLLKKADIPLLGIQRLRNKDKQETTSVRVDLPSKEVKDDIKSKGLKFDLISIKIKDYESHIPRIQQCYRCQGYNHIAKDCPHSQMCLRCSGPHRSSECKMNNPANYLCANCGKNHLSIDPSCLIRKAEIQSMQTKNQGPQRSHIVPSEMNKIKRSLLDQRYKLPTPRGAEYMTPPHQRYSNPKYTGPSKNQQSSNNLSLKEIIEKDQDTAIGLMVLISFITSQLPKIKDISNFTKDLTNLGKEFNLNFNENKIFPILSKLKPIWID